MTEPGWRMVPVAACRILVVDDDPQIRDSVSDLLRLEGYRVDWAANGPVALALVPRSPPDLILLDVHLPGLSGWEVARRLRARGWRVPIVVMTGDSASPEREAELGTDGFLAKP